MRCFFHCWHILKNWTIDISKTKKVVHEIGMVRVVCCKCSKEKEMTEGAYVDMTHHSMTQHEILRG